MTRAAAGPHPWIFLGATLGSTWVLWVSAAIAAGSIPQGGVTALHYLGGLMPLVVAAGLIHLGGTRLSQRDFWSRIIDVRRVSPRWYAVVFLYFPLKTGLAAPVDVLLGGAGIEPEALVYLVGQPLLIVPTLVFWLLFGPAMEEPGWRGYALDGLQPRRSALPASAIVGASWALWHLPLFFIAGTWQAESVGWGTQRFWLFELTIVVESVLFTWIYNNTNRSTLAAILFHFMGNALGQLFALSQRAEVLSLTLEVATVALVITLWGPRTLTGGKRPPLAP